MAPAITIHTDKNPVKAAIPVISPTAGTVAVIVNADGSTKVINASVPAENSVIAYLPDGATVKIVDNSKPFSDVPAEVWFEDAAAFVSARGLFYSTAAAAFAPDAPMSYAVLIMALAGFDGVETSDSTIWYAKSMEWAAARGINTGTAPDSNISFGDLITALWNYSGSPAADNSDVTGTAETEETQKAMNWAVENGIVSGLGDGNSDPQGQISRAQSAQIIMNFIKHTALSSGHN